MNKWKFMRNSYGSIQPFSARVLWKCHWKEFCMQIFISLVVGALLMFSFTTLGLLIDWFRKQICSFSKSEYFRTWILQNFSILTPNNSIANKEGSNNSDLTPQKNRTKSCTLRVAGGGTGRCGTRLIWLVGEPTQIANY